MSVDALKKWLKAWNTDPDIVILLDDTLLYIEGERNDPPQYTKIALHSVILRIGWSSLTLGIIPTSPVCTQQTYFTHIGRKKLGLNRPVKSSHKSRDSSTDNGSTALNSSTW